MKVQDLMSSDVKTCKPESNLAEAAVIMWNNDFGVVPIVDESGRVVSMITDRDIAIASATKGRPASDITVSEVMNGEIHLVSAEESIKNALKTMRERKVRRVPVVDDRGELRGILSINDLVIHAEEGRNNRMSELTYDDVMKTFKVICEHRPQQAAARA